MTNRYANLVGTDLIKDSYDQITTGFDGVQDDIDNHPAWLYRNAIINGDPELWQRETSFAVGASGQYTADRWFARRNSGVTGLTVSRQTGGNARYCIRLQRDSGNTSTNYIWMAQLIETANTIPLRGKTLSLRFRARKGAGYSQASSGITAQVRTGTDVDGTFINTGGGITGEVIVLATAATLTTSWQDFTATATATVGASTNMLQVRFETRVSGVELSGTAGTDDYVEIELIGLNVGDDALPSQPRHIAEELRLCQRYFQIFSGLPFRTVPSSVSVATEIRIHHPLPVTMRTTPTVSLIGTRGTDWALRTAGNVTDTTGSFSSFASTPSTAGLIFTGTTYTASTAYTVSLLTATGAVSIDAEL